MQEPLQRSLQLYNTPIREPSIVVNEPVIAGVWPVWASVQYTAHDWAIEGRCSAERRCWSLQMGNPCPSGEIESGVYKRRAKRSLMALSTLDPSFFYSFSLCGACSRVDYKWRRLLSAALCEIYLHTAGRSLVYRDDINVVNSTSEAISRGIFVFTRSRNFCSM